MELLWTSYSASAQLALCGHIAKNLREFGYRDATAQLVCEELQKPESDRTIIGTMAAGMLEENGVTV